MDINYIKQLNGFYKKIITDIDLNSTHVSLYMALFFQWNQFRFKNPISISRTETMGVSKIGSPKTYTKCLKDLDNWGYIRYVPSKNPLKGSLVYLFNLSNSDNQQRNKLNSKSDHSIEQVLTPSLNNININKDKQYKEVAPTLTEVESFFSEQGLDKTAASKFFNNYESTGWLRGNTPIKNWIALAKYWILNDKGRKNDSPKFDNNDPNYYNDCKF